MGGSSKKQTVGYWYGLGIHFGICHGPVDAVQQITVDDRVAWSGNITSTNQGTSAFRDYSPGNPEIASSSFFNFIIRDPVPGAGEPILINQPTLFGGKKKEGGIKGRLAVCMGGSTQTKNPFLTAHLGANIPAFRGILGLVWNGWISANNPYLKPWAVKVKRILQGWNIAGGCWYSAKAEVGTGNMNPAHIVYQTHTDPEWGMGYPVASINDANFRAVADTLHAEGFGLSLLWNQQGTIESFQQIVMDHIGGIFRTNPTTGLFEIKLIRGDYDPATLPVFDPSNCTLESFQRVAIGETVNEVTVSYTDPTTFNNTSITVHNLANIQAQGGIVSKEVSYHGIRSAELAARVAQRDLIALSTPLAKIRITTNRTAWDVLPGDVIKVNWPKLGINGVVYRVLRVGLGSLENGRIQIDAAEDVFGLPTASYVDQEDIGWSEPGAVPAPAPARLVTEAPYWDLARTLSAADLDYLDPTDGYLSVTSQEPSTDALDASLWTRTVGGDYTDKGQAPHCPVAVVDGFHAKNSTTISYRSGVGLEQLEAGGYLVINGEYMRLDGIDATLETLTVAPGALDTVPKDHLDGETIFFADGFTATDNIQYAETEQVEVIIQTKTSRGELDVNTAPSNTVTMAARQARPYPPGKIRINASAYPGAITGDLALTWSHRDRLQQTAYIVTQDEASIGPEAGTSYTIKVYGNAGTLIHTESGLTGTSWTYTQAAETADAGGYQSQLRVTVESLRGGLTSWQKHDHTFDRAGLGLSLGKYLGGAL